jgi:hypothetical protein
MTIKL